MSENDFFRQTDLIENGEQPINCDEIIGPKGTCYHTVNMEIDSAFQDRLNTFEESHQSGVEFISTTENVMDIILNEFD